jgi:hypothetical protein
LGTTSFSAISSNGVQVSAWVKIEGVCDIEYRVTGNQVEFSLGGDAGQFDFTATRRGLEQLADVGSPASRELGGQP